jgi:serine/threonine/tyrosine-interacting protein
VLTLPPPLPPSSSSSSSLCASHIARGITHVLNLSGMAATYPQRFTYLTIELRDKDHANLLSCIPASNLFMESAIESGGSVLVHCNGGRSRSPALVIAFLMSTLTIPFEEVNSMLSCLRSEPHQCHCFKIAPRACSSYIIFKCLRTYPFSFM